MGTFTQKTNYLKETKSMFKDRLNSLGAEITSSTTFRNYLVWLNNLYNKLQTMTVSGLGCLKGQTSQNGTPTPSSPVPINTTTGEQVVRVSDGNTTNDYEINLGKNLANLNDTIIGKAWNNASNSARAVLYIPVQPSTDYTISYTGTSVDGVYGVFKVGKDDTTGATGVYTISGTRTLTSTATSNWLVIQFAKTSITLEDVLDITLQVEKGNVATSFAEYKTPIELCKIGNYQDKIYKQNGNWYIYKEIGKVVLNGASSENWTLDSTNSRFYNINYINDYMVNQRTNAITNYYRYGDSASDGYFALSGSNNYLFIHFPNSSTNTVALFKTWLSSHNVEVYYVLNTPTTTLIEDEELINQLNEIEIFEYLKGGFGNEIN